MSRRDIQPLNKLLVKIKTKTNNSGTQVPFYPMYLIVSRAANFWKKKIGHYNHTDRNEEELTS
jgi:hypothetical protein